jgi:RND superfamily putative drug exporter
MSIPPHRSNSRFVRVASWCTRHRWQTLVCWLVLVAGAIGLGSSVGTRDIDSFRLPNTESQRAYDLLSEHSPKLTGFSDQIVFVARRGTLRDGPLRERVAATARKLRKSSPIVVAVGAPRLSRDGRTGVVDVTYTDDIDKLKVDTLKPVQQAAFSARGADLRVEHGGQGAQFLAFESQGDPSEFIGLFAAFIVLLITFSSLIAAGIPLLTAIFGLGVTFSLVPVISHLVDTPDFAGQLAALIGIGVGIDYALIVVTRYRAEHARLRKANPDAEDERALREAALLVAMDSAGRTVFFAGLTVMIALLGLLLLGLSFLHGAAIASAMAVLFTMLASLTLLPALLSRAGGWVDRLRLPAPGRARRDAAAAKLAPGESAIWARWAEAVQRRPWPAIAVALVILLGLALPALHMRLGTSDASLDAPGTTTREAYDLIADAFGPGTNGSFLFAVDLPRAGDTAAARQIADAVGRDPGVAQVTQPVLSADREIATVVAFPTTGPQDAATADLLERLRADILPPAERASATQVFVGGQVAGNEDFTFVVSDKLPFFVGAVVLLSALLLMIVFRSLFVPIKAAVMNLLSIGAALGFVTLVFQDGFGAGALGVGEGPIESFVPVMLFAIVFGLSMDYEVFLMSRIHEEWERTGDAARAVRNGVATTGRVITAAASIMIVVFAAFALTGSRVITEFGLGLAMAVLLDALVIRCLLVPALMQLVGARAWWLPKPLDAALPRVAIERE